MTLIFHDIKVGFRNLMKYKLQTLISVLSIAVGIVTLALVQSVMTRFRVPDFFNQAYSDRTYVVQLYTSDGNHSGSISKEIIRALKKDGGPNSAERIAVPNEAGASIPADLLLSDSTKRKGQISVLAIDPEYLDSRALRSAFTGKRIKKLKKNEAVVSADYARKLFGDKDPIGANQTFTGWLPVMIPFTIVDVFETIANDYKISNNVVYLCLEDSIEEYTFERTYFPLEINVTLRENFTESQLIDEINERIEPFGLDARIFKMEKYGTVKYIRTVRTITYLLGSLILLAAVIGFLRIQIQLLALRRRELSLRTVNGAKPRELLGLMITEVAIVIGIAVLLSFLFANILQDFLDSKLGVLLAEYSIRVSGLWHISLMIGGGLMAISILILSVFIVRLKQFGNSIAESIRKRSRHIVRNVALCVQIVICLVFVCSTFILINAGNWLLRFCNVPENDDVYKGFLVLSPKNASDGERLKDEIGRLPDLESMYLYGKDQFYPVMEIKDNPEILNQLTSQQSEYQPMYVADDPSLLSLLGVDVEWIGNSVDRTECILLSESAYNLMERFGLLENNSLSVNLLEGTHTLPIGGIIRRMPYNAGGEFFFVIRPAWRDFGFDRLLVPKPGRDKALAKSVDDVITRLESETINNMVGSYRDQANAFPGIVETIKAVGLILSLVSILISCMGIFSSITLETRARKKEVAIRKVNGAKSRDIFLLFGKVYLLIILFALAVSVPLCVLANNKVNEYLLMIDPSAVLNPLLAIIFGSILVITLIFLIVGWQIHHIMQTDPAKIIAKE